MELSAKKKTKKKQQQQQKKCKVNNRKVNKVWQTLITMNYLSKTPSEKLPNPPLKFS